MAAKLSWIRRPGTAPRAAAAVGSAAARAPGSGSGPSRSMSTPPSVRYSAGSPASRAARAPRSPAAARSLRRRRPWRRGSWVRPGRQRRAAGVEPVQALEDAVVNPGHPVATSTPCSTTSASAKSEVPRQHQQRRMGRPAIRLAAGSAIAATASATPAAASTAGSARCRSRVPRPAASSARRSGRDRGTTNQAHGPVGERSRGTSHRRACPSPAPWCPVPRRPTILGRSGEPRIMRTPSRLAAAICRSRRRSRLAVLAVQLLP